MAGLILPYRGIMPTIADGVFVAPTGSVIGDDVTIGHGAIVHACTLEDGCFIGMGATVMDGAVVESKAMVAAGALVAPGKRVKSGELWAGVPAKFRRPLDNDDLDNMAHVTPLYVKLAKDYLEAGI